MRIAAQLFPYDTWPVDKLLFNLGEAGLIRRYEIENQKCIQIINFVKHQNPHPKETNYGLPPCREISGNSGELQEVLVDSHVLTHGLMDYGLSPPTPSQQAVEKSVRKTSERESGSKSRFSLKECEQYAAARKGIKTPKAFAKTIWRSGEDDDAIAAYQSGHSGQPIKKPPDEPLDPVELNRLADELEPTHHDAAQALRASIQAK